MGNLLTQQQVSALPDLYTTEDVQDPICHFKFFTPDSNWSWFLIELESVKDTLGLNVELDISFTPQPLSEVKRGN